MDPEDISNNRYAIPREYQITGCYKTHTGVEIWIATHGNRAATYMFTRAEA